VRFNALSRAIESALQKEGIPSRVLGGHKFFERLEARDHLCFSSRIICTDEAAQIKDLLAYLQLVDNPQFVPAFSRAVNVPSRGIGEKVCLHRSIVNCCMLLTAPPSTPDFGRNYVQGGEGEFVPVRISGANTRFKNP
jgi:hypothetical protein